MADRRRRRRNSSNTESECSEGEDVPELKTQLSIKKEAPKESECESEFTQGEETSEYDSTTEGYDEEETETEDDDETTEDVDDNDDDVIIEDDDWVDEERQLGDGEEEPNSKNLDDDEDKKNPAYIPRKGAFYEHDTRLGEEAKEEKEAPVPKKKLWTDAGKWDHSRYSSDQQAPKSRDEIIAIYGYDIRSRDKPPDAAPRGGKPRGGRPDRSRKFGDYFPAGDNRRQNDYDNERSYERDEDRSYRGRGGPRGGAPWRGGPRGRGGMRQSQTPRSGGYHNQDNTRSYNDFKNNQNNSGRQTDDIYSTEDSGRQYQRNSSSKDRSPEEATESSIMRPAQQKSIPPDLIPTGHANNDQRNDSTGESQQQRTRFRQGHGQGQGHNQGQGHSQGQGYVSHGTERGQREQRPKGPRTRVQDYQAPDMEQLDQHMQQMSTQDNRTRETQNNQQMSPANRNRGPPPNSQHMPQDGRSRGPPNNQLSSQEPRNRAPQSNQQMSQDIRHRGPARDPQMSQDNRNRGPPGNQQVSQDTRNRGNQPKSQDNRSRGIQSNQPVSQDVRMMSIYPPVTMNTGTATTASDKMAVSRSSEVPSKDDMASVVPPLTRPHKVAAPSHNKEVDSSQGRAKPVDNTRTKRYSTQRQRPLQDTTGYIPEVTSPNPQPIQNMQTMPSQNIQQQQQNVQQQVPSHNAQVVPSQNAQQLPVQPTVLTSITPSMISTIPTHGPPGHVPIRPPLPQYYGQVFARQPAVFRQPGAVSNASPPHTISFPHPPVIPPPIQTVPFSLAATSIVQSPPRLHMAPETTLATSNMNAPVVGPRGPPIHQSMLQGPFVHTAPVISYGPQAPAAPPQALPSHFQMTGHVPVRPHTPIQFPAAPPPPPTQNTGPEPIQIRGGTTYFSHEAQSFHTGTTYFSPEAQQPAPVIRETVSRRPKAAIPIVNPVEMPGGGEEFYDQEAYYVEDGYDEGEEGAEYTQYEPRMDYTPGGQAVEYTLNENVPEFIPKEREGHNAGTLAVDEYTSGEPAAEHTQDVLGDSHTRGEQRDEFTPNEPETKDSQVVPEYVRDSGDMDPDCTDKLTSIEGSEYTRGTGVEGAPDDGKQSYLLTETGAPPVSDRLSAQDVSEVISPGAELLQDVQLSTEQLETNNSTDTQRVSNTSDISPNTKDTHDSHNIDITADSQIVSLESSTHDKSENQQILEHQSEHLEEERTDLLEPEEDPESLRHSEHSPQRGDSLVLQEESVLSPDVSVLSEEMLVSCDGDSASGMDNAELPANEPDACEENIEEPSLDYSPESEEVCDQNSSEEYFSDTAEKLDGESSDAESVVEVVERVLPPTADNENSSTKAACNSEDTSVSHTDDLGSDVQVSHAVAANQGTEKIMTEIKLVYTEAKQT